MAHGRRVAPTGRLEPLVAPLERERILGYVPVATYRGHGHDWIRNSRPRHADFYNPIKTLGRRRHFSATQGWRSLLTLCGRGRLGV